MLQKLFESTWRMVILAMLLIAPVAFSQIQKDASVVTEAADKQVVANEESQTSKVLLNFPKNVDLSVLVEYVSQRLGINFIYDEQLSNKRVTIKAPQQIPAESLMGLLESVLHIKGFTLVQAAQPGFMRIAPSAAMTEVTQLTADQGHAQAKGTTIAMTQVIQLKYAEPKIVAASLKPYLSKPGGNMFSIAGQNMLVVSDIAMNVRRIAKLIALLDQPTPERQIEVYSLSYAQSKELALKIKQIMQLKNRSRGRRTTNTMQAVECLSDDRTNQIMAMGTPKQLMEVKALIQSLDIPIPANQNPVKFYKLLHRSAEDVLVTLKSIQGEDGLETTTIQSLFNSSDSHTQPNPKASPTSPAQGPSDSTTPQTSSEKANGKKSASTSQSPKRSPPSTASTIRITKPKLARVAADIHTNSIVVVAKPPIQKIYAALIKELDSRRPQVLLEATVVALDTSNNFALGVEISADGGANRGKIISFSSFGLSTIDASTGSITPGVSSGFNFSLLNADVANVVLKALKSTGRAKVASAPKILVNDNESGTLSSTSQEPYVSVNASTTVATTSFGGNAEAGTTITLTPHISNGDYLQLEYNIELSSFTGNRTDNLPPPSQKNTIESRVTIPDGKTIVLGGLKRNNYRKSVTSIPILGDIPILKDFFSSQTDETSEAMLFVFIKASILRDDGFRDLQYLSEYDVKASEQSGDYPTSEPIWMN